MAKLLEENTPRFKTKIFTPAEINYCENKAEPAIHFAGRFAAKEAIKKALLSSNRKLNVPFNRLEIMNDENGAPLVKILPESQDKNSIRVSISHTEDFAIAFAVYFEP
jgi:holo-[acyl-carrier protein] synthase